MKDDDWKARMWSSDLTILAMMEESRKRAEQMLKTCEERVTQHKQKMIGRYGISACKVLD